MGEYVYCLECNPPKKFKQITSTHLKKEHEITVKEYLKLHPDANIVAQSIREKLVAANKVKWSDPDYKDRVAKTISGVITQQWDDGFYSRIQTEDHAMKRSISAQKTKAKTPEKYSGENNSNYNPEIDKWIKEHQGKHFCECGCGEEIEILRFHYHSGIPKFKYNHQFGSPEIIEKMRQARLKQKIPTRETKIEHMVQDILTCNGYSFETHKSICKICIPDMVFFDRKIAVFCDGDYWHNYPDGNDKDHNQDKVLAKNGWRVIRFWEHEIHENLQDCFKKIKAIYNDTEFIPYCRQKTLDEWM